ncbi:hypothetical protein QBC38DRAFT_461412 [Podospora fimiseda]|uniref:Uncharacterized protein n=1 Tax=Podospora fimiseda TaxID=252190 RepID=A0AAN6YLL4_9PEZI|nr:hypothetical protein QBC38DRAFT_461412 [Podospora fimiseda]
MGTTTLVPTSSLSDPRLNLGPLTTVFTAPQVCEQCINVGTMVGTDTFTTIACIISCSYPRDGCSEDVPPDICLPNNPVISAIVDAKNRERFGFYSPGLQCPDGWDTATVLSHGIYNLPGDIHQAVLGTLQSDETAAVCCPTGFNAFFPELNAACSAKVSHWDFSYYNVDSLGGCSSEAWSETQEITVWVDPDWRPNETVTDDSGKPNETVFWATASIQYGISIARAIQLVWRPEDRLGTTNVKRLEPGQIVGIILGVIAVIILMIVGTVIIRRRYTKRRRTSQDHKGNELTQPEDSLPRTRTVQRKPELGVNNKKPGNSNIGGGQTPTQNGELQAGYDLPEWYSELPSRSTQTESSVTPAAELFTHVELPELSTNMPQTPTTSNKKTPASSSPDFVSPESTYNGGAQFSPPIPSPSPLSNADRGESHPNRSK